VSNKVVLVVTTLGVTAGVWVVILRGGIDWDAAPGGLKAGIVIISVSAFCQKMALR
jgi:hypothetical protein